MSGTKKPSILRQSSHNSLHVNPLNDPKHNRCFSEGGRSNSVTLGVHMKENPISVSDDKENAAPNEAKAAKFDDKENAVPRNEGGVVGKKLPDGKIYVRDRALKPSSLQLCMQQNEPDSSFGDKFWEQFDLGGGKENVNVWDLSDSEAAPASSWSSLPNRVLLCRPLPVDIGRCTCVIVKEALPEGLDGGTLYSLYTNEGKGRQNRKLAMAHHRRRNGRSEFVLAQKLKGILCSSDDSFLGTVTSNIMGSKYHIWDQAVSPNSLSKQSKPPLSVVSFVPTLATWTGSYRRMRVWIPKHHSMVLKNAAQVQHIAGLPKDWEEKADKVQQLYSRIPHYNNVSKQYELDFRDRARAGLKIQSSVKNFQLILEKNGRQTILQLGRVGKSKYVMDYRYPMTGFQAFSTCLASIDSKLCCAL